MRIIQNYLTQNDCYKANKKITVKGLMLHSVGTPQPYAEPIMAQWNRPAIEQNGRQVCVHAFVEASDTVHQNLPWNLRGWHAGGGANNTHIGVEMTEPATIKYTNYAAWIDLDPPETKKHVLATYKTAVELFAFLCQQYKLDPLKDGVIISHSEGFKRGIADNHADVEHLWNKFGLTMVQFRKDIYAAMHPVVSGVPVPLFTISRNLRYRLFPMMQGEDVRAVQNMLKVKGYDIGKSGADSWYGKDTKRAVERFQSAKRLVADGIVGRLTVIALGGAWKA